MKQLIKQLLRESLLDEGKFIGSLYQLVRELKLDLVLMVMLFQINTPLSHLIFSLPRVDQQMRQILKVKKS